MARPSDASAPTLSVVTPSYNSARFIEETLDSVAALSVPHEHIVIDGGSDDGTVEILESRGDDSLVWISEPDRGQTNAVNKGLERTRGELIAWINADDAYVPPAVDRTVRGLQKDPSIDAIFGFMDIVDENGEFQRQYRCGRWSWRRYLYFGHYIPTVTVIFRRALLAHAPRLDERYADAADYDFYLRLLRGAKVARTRRSLVRFRYHAASKTASGLGVQVHESMDIRLRYARNKPERQLMKAAARLVTARNLISSPWPDVVAKG